MSVKPILIRPAAAIAAAVVGILTTAIFLRGAAFWAPHADPVEMAYTSLAMKMGIHPSLEGYHLGGVQIQRKEVSRAQDVSHPGESAAPPVPILFPVEVSPVYDKSFAAWPKDSNPFYYKPPLFPSLLTYNHHRKIGAKVQVYPVLESLPDARTGQAPENTVRGQAFGKSKVVWDVQFWAIQIPFISGLIVVALTLILGWRAFGAGTGLVAGLITATHPLSILMSGKIWPETTLTACLLGAVCLFHFFTSIRSWAGCLLAGLMYGLAVLTDASALFALPAFFIWAAWISARPAEQPAGVWTRLRPLFNPSFAAFVAGTVWIGKVWFDYTWSAFGDFAWRHAVTVPASGSDLFASILRHGAQIFLLFPPLAAAFFSLAALRPAKGASSDPSRSVRLMWLFVLSLIGTRGLYSPRVPWDERTLSAAFPFLAILSAAMIVRFFDKFKPTASKTS